MSEIELGKSVEFNVTVHDDDGSMMNADSTPTLTVYKNNVAVGSLTNLSMTNNATGKYTYTVAITDSNFAAGDRVRGEITATINSVTSTAVAGVYVVKDTAEVVWEDATFDELTTTPPATPSPAEAMMLAYMALRNNTQATSNQRIIKNDAGTIVSISLASDIAGIFSQGKLQNP